MSTEEFINEIVHEMAGKISNEKLKELRDCLFVKLYNRELIDKNTALSVQDTDTTNNVALERYATDMLVMEKSKNTIKQYISQTQRFLEYINKPYNEISKNDIVMYLYNRRKDGLSDRSVLNVFRFIKPFFNWLHRNDYIEKNPFDKVEKIKVPDIQKVSFTETEIENIRDSCTNDYELSLVDFLLSTGVRVGELVSINLEDVDFNNDTVTIYATKTRTYREVYLNAKAKKHLIDYRNSLKPDRLKSNALFLSKRYNRLDPRIVEKSLKAISKKANINKKSTVHIYRKTFATQLISKGCPPTTVSTLLGHKSFSTTHDNYLNQNRIDIKNTFMKYSL